MLTSNNIIILVIQQNKDLIVKYGYSLARLSLSIREKIEILEPLKRIK